MVAYVKHIAIFDLDLATIKFSSAFNAMSNLQRMIVMEDKELVVAVERDHYLKNFHYANLTLKFQDTFSNLTDSFQALAINSSI